MADNMKGIPVIFMQEYSEESFKKRIMSKLFIHEYRNFINSVFIIDESGNYKLKEDLTVKEKKTLKKIAKSIRSNTGYVLRGRIALILILVGGIIFFNALFLDKIIERSVERGLERVFEAKAEIRGLDLQFFNPRIYFNSLEVADSRNPYRNLFQMGTTEIDFNLEQALRGKVILDNLEFQEIQWGTERETSGALPGIKPAVSEDDKEIEEATFTVSLIQNVDSIARAIIEKEKDKLKSPELIEELPGNYLELKSRWEKKIDGYKRDIKDIKESIERVRNINPDEIKNLESAVTNYKIVEKAYSEIKVLESGLEESYAEFNEDLDKVKSDRMRIENVISDDFKHLSSFIVSSEKGKSIAESILHGLMEKYLGNIMSRIERWRYYFDKLRPLTERQVGKEVRLRSLGRNVTYPGTGVPRLWLKNSTVSIGSREKRDLYGINLKDVTSNNELINKPTTFYLMRIDEKKEMELSGLIDTRKEKERTAVFNIKMDNMSFSIKEGIKTLRLKNLNCNYNIEGELSFDRFNRAGGSFDIKLFNIVTELLDEKNIFARNISELLTSNAINMKVVYIPLESGGHRMSITSNLYKLLSGMVESMIRDGITEVEKKLREEFNKILEPYIQKYEKVYKEYVGLEDDFQNNLTDVNTYRKVIDDKKEEIDRRIEEIKEESKEKVEEKVKEEIEDLLDKFKF